MVRVEVNEIETKKTTVKIKETKICFFFLKRSKLLGSLTKKKIKGGLK